MVSKHSDKIYFLIFFFFIAQVFQCFILFVCFFSFVSFRLDLGVMKMHCSKDKSTSTLTNVQVIRYTFDLLFCFLTDSSSSGFFFLMTFLLIIFSCLFAGDQMA